MSSTQSPSRGQGRARPTRRAGRRGGPRAAPRRGGAAELATTTGIGVDNYDPTLLTYTSGFDADGNPIAIGWGPTTLPSAQQQQASAALIRAIAAGLPGSV